MNYILLNLKLISHDIPNSDYNINSNNNVFYIHEYETASVVTEKNYNASVQINEREQVSPKDYKKSLQVAVINQSQIKFIKV